MSFSKQLVAILPLLFCTHLFAASVVPIYPSYPTITLNATGAAPTYSGIPVCTQTIGLNLLDKAGATMNIDSIYFVNDTLHIVPGKGIIIFMQNADKAAMVDIVGPTNYAYTTVFDTWGTYTVVLQDTATKTRSTKIGSVQIYPYFTTSPSQPLASTATRLNLVLGQSHTLCNPVYTNLQVRIKADTIALKFTEALFDGPCPAIYSINPITYGPTYDLGTLDTGAYVVKVDTLTVGKISVAAGFSITGRATIMKSPYTKSMEISIANALITGIVYIPCSWDLSRSDNFDTVTTTTGAAGAFSLLLPRSGYQYTISSQKTGYYPQSIAINTAASVSPLSFQLISTGMDTVGTLNVTVKKNSAPVESVSVSISSGPEMRYCITPMAKQQAQVSVNKFTNMNGTISFANLSLIPFIDFAYLVTYNKNGFSYYKFGSIRLNPFVATNLDIDIANTGTNPSAVTQLSPLSKKLSGRTLSLSWADQKFGKEVTVSLFDIKGRSVLQRTLENGGRVSLASLAGGRYLVRIASPRGVVNEGLMLP